MVINTGEFSQLKTVVFVFVFYKVCTTYKIMINLFNLCFYETKNISCLLVVVNKHLVRREVASYSDIKLSLLEKNTNEKVQKRTGNCTIIEKVTTATN